ncbi:histidinol-phosphate transaminase [Corynebacterium hansenii]|uniref:Aromatic amino acid aminotransferase n=1 Tax=Corynebacterium hansenii TaxID=394964 RepID=A0ABV7ZNP6_9CORY|nr:histidinol-phosphate transaminase [Corynebacterium hansenii]WJY98780.1 Putative phenylalanine aminotransferase [Corynebacterium hansenii]
MTREDLNLIPSYVPGKMTPGALKLASNEMTQGPLPSVRDAIVDAAAGVNRYPDMAAVDVRATIADHLGLQSEQVAVGCGSSALCQQLIQATCADGDEVLFAWRSFEAYPILARVAGAVPVAVPLDADHRHDLDAMAERIGDRTRLIFVCNPNNPSGTTITAAEFEAFMAKVPGDVVVALDEAYIEFVRPADGDLGATGQATGVDTPNAVDAVAKYPNVVGLRTFSKVYGLAGLRIGYCFGAAELIEALNKVCIPFSVNALAQVAAIESLRSVDELEARIAGVRDQRVRVTAAVNGAAGAEVVVPDSQTNFVWLPEERLASLAGTGSLSDAHVADSRSFAEFLAEKGIVVRFFAGEGVRITVTDAPETDRLLAALGL